MLRTVIGLFVFVIALAIAIPDVVRAQEPADAPASPVSAEAPDTSGGTPAKQAYMVDFDSGMVLFDKASGERMPTSSMSKVITMYLIFEALKTGKMTLDTTLPVSEKAWRMQGSKMFVELGKQIKVEDLIRGVIIQSGNDATITLAEGLHGTEEAFADALNAKAKELGMNDSHFMNASGWPDPEHYSTAHDLVVLGEKIIRDFPEYYPYYKETEYTYHNITQANRNPLLYRNIGADGIKTGHTEAAGYGLMGSATDGKRRVVMVLNGMVDEKVRAQESARLIEWGLKTFENVTLFKAGETVDQAFVVMGQAEQVALTVDKDILITIPRAVKGDLKVEAIYNSPLEAPVKKGQQVGTLKIDVPRLKTFEVPLVAAVDVDRIGFFAGMAQKAKLLAGGAPATP